MRGRRRTASKIAESLLRLLSETSMTSSVALSEYDHLKMLHDGLDYGDLLRKLGSIMNVPFITLFVFNI